MLYHSKHQKPISELSLEAFLKENIGAEYIFKFFEDIDLAQLIYVNKTFYKYILTNFKENLDNYTDKCIDHFLFKQAARNRIDIDDFFKMNYGFFIKQKLLRVLESLNENETENHFTIDTKLNVISDSLKDVLTEIITFTSSSNDPEVYHFKLALPEEFKIDLKGFYYTQRQLMVVKNLNTSITECYDLKSQSPQTEAIKNILSFISYCIFLEVEAEHKEKIALKIKLNPNIIEKQKKYQRNLDFKSMNMLRLLRFNALALLLSCTSASLGIIFSFDFSTITFLCFLPFAALPIYLALLKHNEFKYRTLSAEDYIGQENFAENYTEAEAIYNNRNGFFSKLTADIENQNFDDLQDESSDDERTFLLMEASEKTSYGM